MDLPVISVIVPFKKSEQSVLNCLQSIFDMDYPMEKLEVIVLDDSLDDALFNQVRRRFPIARLLRNQTPLGCDGSKQAGIDAANGDIVALTDADCTVSPRWARVIAKELDSGAEVVTGPVKHSKAFFEELVGISDFQDFQDTGYRPMSNFPGCNFAANKAIFKDMRYQTACDMRYGADRIASWRMHLNGLKIRYNPAMEICHSPAVNVVNLLERRLRYGRKAFLLRRVDPTLPGSVITRLGPLAALAYILYKSGKDACCLLKMACLGRINPWHTPFLLPALLSFRLVDALGVLTYKRLQH